MKILFVLKQKKNVETFAATIRALTERGHSVSLAVQEHTETRAHQYRDALDSPLFSLVRCPAHRTDRWSDVAWLLRSLRDCVHYQQPAMRNAIKLQARSLQKLREELRVNADNEAVASANTSSTRPICEAGTPRKALATASLSALTRSSSRSFCRLRACSLAAFRIAGCW